MKMGEDREQVFEFFNSNVCDWTPKSACDVVRVLYLPIDITVDSFGKFSNILSDVEQQRARKFISKDDRENFILRRVFRRYCGSLALDLKTSLSLIEFEENEKGRPYFPHHPEYIFSFSSCKSGIIGAWSATHHVGVDVENLSANLDAAEIAQHYFSEAEAKCVEALEGKARTQAFFQFWSLKEAALKSIGEGLPFGLDAFVFSLALKPTISQVPQGYGSVDRYRAYMIEKKDNLCGYCFASQKRIVTLQY